MNLKRNFYYGRHSVNNFDAKNVLKVLKSKAISQGDELKRLEENVAKYFKSKYCVAVSSASAALHLSVNSLKIKKPFYGVTSPNTFAATTNAIIHSGGDIDLVDICEEDYNLSIDYFKKYLEKKIRNRQKLPKIVIPVHFAGLSINMKELKKICLKNNIKIIEDASQAMGGKYEKKFIGNCKYSDLTVFSMHPVKSITSGEGGLILTNNETIYKNLLKLRINGVDKKNSRSWEQDVNEFGFNYKISELNCALANSQLKRLNKFIKFRKKLAKQYLLGLDQKIFKFQKQNKNADSAWHLFVIEFRKKISKKNKDVFYEKLKKNGIFLDVKYRPIQSFSIYKKNFKFSNLQNSENYFKQSFCVPLYFDLKVSDVNYIIKKINSISQSMKL